MHNLYVHLGSFMKKLITSKPYFIYMNKYPPELVRRTIKSYQNSLEDIGPKK